MGHGNPVIEIGLTYIRNISELAPTVVTWDIKLTSIKDNSGYIWVLNYDMDERSPPSSLIWSTVDNLQAPLGVRPEIQGLFFS